MILLINSNTMNCLLQCHQKYSSSQSSTVYFYYPDRQIVGSRSAVGLTCPSCLAIPVSDLKNKRQENPRRIWKITPPIPDGHTQPISRHRVQGNNNSARP